MAPRLVRPRSDAARWPLALLAGVVSLALGYVAAARVFRPPGATTASTDEGEGPQAGDAMDTADAGATDAAVLAQGEPATLHRTPPPPRVGVRVLHSLLQSCGDGEELTTPGAQCGAVPGLETTLGSYLAELGNCPSAEQAAGQREAVLSIGLRADFTRHRVTALPGRSSSVRDPLTYVACARTALEHTEAVWRLHAPHARYLYFYAVRFGPVRAATADNAAANGTAGNGSSPTGNGASVTGNGASATGNGASATAAGGAPTGTGAAPTGSGAAPTGSGAAPTWRPGAPTWTAGAPTSTANGPTGAPGTPATTGSEGVTAVPVHPEDVPVVWERALVRDAPRTGAIVARLPQGATVTVIGRRGSWWQVRFHGAATEGWLYGEAIGR